MPALCMHVLNVALYILVDTNSKYHGTYYNT